MALHESHLIHFTLTRSVAEVYAYVSKPQNFAQWAAVVGPMRQVGPLEWKAEMAFGMRIVRFTEPNPYGVLDHAIYKEGDEPVVMPMRVTANGDGCDLIFVFFRRDGMTDEQFASGVEWVNADFLALRSILEA
jgi:hypothetical protein